MVGITSDPDTLFPWKATQFQAVNVLGIMYGTLTELDEDLNVVPGLAESWDVSEDGLTVTLHLRTGVTFTDGSTFGSEDVVSSLEQIQDEATAAVAAASLASVTGVEAPDESTVVLTLSAPDAALAANLASVNLAMLSSDDTEEALNTAPNGTGPFNFDAREPSQSLTLVRNDAYWGDAAAARRHRVPGHPGRDLDRLGPPVGQRAVRRARRPDRRRDGQAPTSPSRRRRSSAYHVLQLNARKGALTDLNVRLAIQCAIDRQQVLDTAAFGEGEVTGPITSPAYRSDPAARPCPERDLDKAAEYLEAAGMADGVTIQTIVSQGEYATSVERGREPPGPARRGGHHARARGDGDRHVRRPLDRRRLRGRGRAQRRPPRPGRHVRPLLHEHRQPQQGRRLQLRQLDELFAAGKATTDPEERAGIYEQISAELENNAVWIWLFTSYTYTATTADVTGFIPMANGSLQYLRATSLG